jgi:hypothetical protein
VIRTLMTLTGLPAGALGLGGREPGAHQADQYIEPEGVRRQQGVGGALIASAQQFKEAGFIGFLS